MVPNESNSEHPEGFIIHLPEDESPDVFVSRYLEGTFILWGVHWSFRVRLLHKL